MLFLIIAWSLLLITSFQIGSSILDISKADCFERIGDRFVVSVWLGIIIIANMLLAISVFSRLSLSVVSALSIGLILFSFLLRRKIYVKTLKLYLSPGLIFGFIALLTSIGFVTTQVVTWYDTGGYHFGIIKWLSRYGAVPGLALIYYGFGYTSSWFALGATFNDWILDARASTLTGGFAFLMLIMHLWICLVRVFAKRAEIEDWFLVISFLLALTVITRFEIYVSPSSDLPVIILTIVTAWSFIIISRQNSKVLSNKDQFSHLNNGIIPLIFSAGAVSIKLSAMPILFISALFYLFLKKISTIRVLALVSIILLLLMPFFMVQAVTSGCLLYPSALICLDLPWTVSPEKIEEVTEQILKAAQWHSITPPKGESLNWFFPWLVREKFQTGLILLAVLTFIFSVKKLRNGCLHWAKWPLAMGVIGLFYTMVMGPTWRYSLGYLSIISGLFIGMYCDKKYPGFESCLANLQTKFSHNFVPMILLFTLGMAIPAVSAVRNNFKAFNYLRLEIYDAVNKGDISTAIYDRFRLLLPPKVLNFQLAEKNSGGSFTFTVSDLELVNQTVNDVHFYKPKKGYQCWDAELPCTQLLTNENIRLRDPRGGIGKGFVRTKIK